MKGRGGGGVQEGIEGEFQTLFQLLFFVLNFFDYGLQYSLSSKIVYDKSFIYCCSVITTTILPRFAHLFALNVLVHSNMILINLCRLTSHLRNKELAVLFLA